MAAPREARQTAYNKGRMAYHKATSSPYIGWSAELEAEFNRGYADERKARHG